MGTKVGDPVAPALPKLPDDVAAVPPPASEPSSAAPQTAPAAPPETGFPKDDRFVETGPVAQARSDAATSSSWEPKVTRNGKNTIAELGAAGLGAEGKKLLAASWANAADVWWIVARGLKEKGVTPDSPNFASQFRQALNQYYERDVMRYDGRNAGVFMTRNDLSDVRASYRGTLAYKQAQKPGFVEKVLPRFIEQMEKIDGEIVDKAAKKIGVRVRGSTDADKAVVAHFAFAKERLSDGDQSESNRVLKETKELENAVEDGAALYGELVRSFTRTRNPIAAIRAFFASPIYMEGIERERNERIANAMATGLEKQGVNPVAVNLGRID